MRSGTIGTISVWLASFMAVLGRADDPQPKDYHGWPGYVWENELVRLTIVPELGGRVIQFALGSKEFFWVNPQLLGKQPPSTGLDADGSWLNYGGDKLWPAPQGWDNAQQWPGPPDAVLDGQPYRAEVLHDPTAVRLTSRDDPRSGIRFSRRLRLHPESSHVSVDATMTNIDDQVRRWGIWAHTQFDAGLAGSEDYNPLMRAWCPINAHSHFPDGYQVIFGTAKNPSFQADAERKLMRVSFRYEVGKIGLDSDAGWVATVDGRTGDVFVQRYTYEPTKEYPDGASVEFWHNGRGRIHAYGRWIDQPDDLAANPYVFESEVLSPFAQLAPGEEYTWTYHWYACRIGGDFPVIDCTPYGVVSEAITCQKMDRQFQVRGRLGVFFLGSLRWKTLGEAGQVVAEGELVAQTDPRQPIVLDHRIALPAASTRLSIVVWSPSGEELGEVASAAIPRR